MGTVERVESHQGLLGVLMVLERKLLTRGIQEALARGSIELNGKKYPKFQSLTIEDYFSGSRAD